MKKTKQGARQDDTFFALTLLFMLACLFCGTIAVLEGFYAFAYFMGGAFFLLVDERDGD